VNAALHIVRVAREGVHRFGASPAVLAVCAVLMACSAVPPDDTRLLRNPTVPIGAITRFDPVQFDGTWQVVRTAGGDWDVTRFTVSESGTAWAEGQATGRIVARGPGILQITFGDATARDLWVLWIDPDHNTAALGDPEGRFGFVATRVGTRRADQITAAEQVLDFNGYRTKSWAKVL